MSGVNLTKTYDLPASVEDAYAVITDEDFQLERVGAIGHGSTAAVSRSGETAVVRIEIQQPTDGAPAPVRSVVGDHLTVIDERQWGEAAADGAREADLRVHTVGAPITLTGSAALRPTAAGCQLVIDGDLRCTIPLIGRSLEGQIAGAIGQVVDEEAAALARRLGD